MPTTRPSLVRVFQIHRIIAERRFPSLRDLAEQCGVSARTVKRDLRTLREEFGAPLARDRAQGGYSYAKPFNLDALPLSEGELLAVCMLRSLVDGAFRNTHLAPAVRGALEKLRILLPETVQTAVTDDAHSAIAYFPDPSPPENPDTCAIFKTLMNAIAAHQPVRMAYFSMTSNRERRRTVDPYLLFHRDGMWYLRAY
ncbi:MAG TPA: WYL domain-containing protein, partial [Armatimonadota bacterium]|nr:WYL domain-containing protein [Armatimonadota bacterium]